MSTPIVFVAGQLNKQIGGDLGISPITVKAHCGHVTAFRSRVNERRFTEVAP